MYRQRIYALDPNTLERDPKVLRDIGRRFGGRLALNAWVVREGHVREGDPVILVRPEPDPASKAVTSTSVCRSGDRAERDSNELSLALSEVSRRE